MAKVELKQPIVDEIKAQLDGAKSMVVVDYRGISVADVTELRKQCREAGVVYKVYKNTMVKRAVEGITHSLNVWLLLSQHPGCLRNPTSFST